jgi:non-heme Fe2+,alpha-ketoglutarate-dependent halogenase
MSNYKLSEEEIKKFRDQGYIGPFKAYDNEYIKQVYKKLRVEFFNREKAPYQVDASSPIANYDRHLDVNFLSTHIMNPKLVDRVESILGSNLLCWRSELFPKYPGDEGTDWHQADTFAHASGKPQIAWPNGSRFGGAITVWMALTDTDKKNGCLRFIPGTHEEMFYDESLGMEYTPEAQNTSVKQGKKMGFFGYDYRNLQKDKDWVPDESSAVDIEMKAGEFVIFWSTLMHSSNPNNTADRTRLGFAARYVPSSVHVYPDTEVVEEYGSSISLENFGVVNVKGEVQEKRNKVLANNLHGNEFQFVELES